MVALVYAKSTAAVNAGGTPAPPRGVTGRTASGWKESVRKQRRDALTTFVRAFEFYRFEESTNNMVSAVRVLRYIVGV